MFYKNILFTLPLFYYGFFSGMSGTIFYDTIIFQFYNTLYTAGFPAVFAILDKEFGQGEYLANHPYLYRRGSTGKIFTYQLF
jgi:hypothetical protein